MFYAYSNNRIIIICGLVLLILPALAIALPQPYPEVENPYHASSIWHLDGDATDATGLSDGTAVSSHMILILPLEQDNR